MYVRMYELCMHYVCIIMYVCMYVCVHYVCMCVCMYLYMYVCVCMYLSTYVSMYTGCPRKNVPEFERVFLMLNYTDITHNSYVRS